MNTDIRDLSFHELSEYFKNQNEQPFRATQIFDWIYKKDVTSLDGMRNLSTELRDKLKKDFFFAPQTFETEAKSTDRTKKYLFTLSDGEKVETVLIPTPERSTVCVSTQAGCKFGCKFCASGIGGWMRDLSSAEILNQIIYARRMAAGQPLTHIVFMGTGEPLDNYENLLKAVRIINAPEGLQIAARRI